MKRVIYSKEATKALDAMPANIARLIKAKLALYAENSDALGNNVKALQGERRELRLRVGDWRIVFKEDKETITIIRVASRGSAYD